METGLFVILSVVFSIAFSIAINALLDGTFCFNANVDYPKGLNLPEFKVIEIKEAYSTGFKQVAEYTVVNCFFKRKNARGWVYRKYKFYDEPGKYKIGDILTLR